LILLGFTYSIYVSALWSSIPYCCKAKQVGTAYGIATAVQNGGLALGPVIVGVIEDNTKDFKDGFGGVSIFLMGVSVIGTIFGFILYFVDKNRFGGNLNKNATQLYF
jgi:MFS family permease